MMNGGNILVLQRILGHANLAMTMRYAHFAPSHLEEARRLNPLAEEPPKILAAKTSEPSPSPAG
jgi:integrase